MFDINSIIQTVKQIYDMLSVSEAGIVIQSILLLFLGLGLLLTIRLKKEGNRSIFKRTVLGIVLLAVINIGLLVILIFENNILSLNLDVQFVYIGITLINIILIIWLWVFPEPEKAVDITAGLIGVLIIILVGLALFWLPSSGFYSYLENILFGIASGLAAFGFLLVGGLFLLFKRPALWGFGLLSLILILIGCVVQIIVLPYQYDYPAAVYLAFALSFPLFMILPFRFYWGLRSDELDFDKKEKEELLRHLEQQQAVLDRRPSYTDPKILQAIIEIMSQEQLNEVCTKIAVTIGRIMRADICAVLSPPDEDGRIEIYCGYDSKNEAVLEKVEFKSDQLPQIQSANVTGSVINTTNLDDQEETSRIAQDLALGEAGPTLYIPVLNSKNESVAGVLLMSPYTGREWTDGDEYYIGILAKLLIYFFYQRKDINNLKLQLDESRTLELEARDLYREAKLSHQLFLDQVSHFKEKDIPQRSRFEQLIASQTEGAEFQTVQEITSVEEASEDIAKRWIPEFETSELDRLQSELNLALQEISLLRSELDQSRRENS